MSYSSKNSLSTFISIDKTGASAISSHRLQILVEDVKEELVSIINIDLDNLSRISVDASVDLEAKSY